MKVFYALTVLSMLLVPLKASFADAPPKTLLLLTYHDQLPWQRVLLTGYRERLSQITKPYQIYEERFDIIRLGTKDLKERELAVLQKYRGLVFDQVIAESDTAAQFLIDNTEAFKTAKKYFVNTSINLPNNMGVSLNGLQDFKKGLETIKNVTPNLTKLVVLDESRERAGEIMSLGSQVYGSSVSIEHYEGFSFEELYAKVSSLGPNSAILFCLITGDKTGKSVVPYELAHELSQKTKRPIFVIYDTLLGSGVAGGYVLSARKTGQYIANIVGGETQTTSSFNGFYFDYGAAVSRGIDVGKLPSETIFINKPSNDFSNFLLILVPTIIFAGLQVVIIVALFRSLSAKKKANAQLQSEREHLAETVAERTKELLAAKEAAEAASEAKSLFLANMSHELRTPLNAVIGLSHILHESGLKKDQIDYNRQIIDSSKHLLSLIGDVLDFSKIESGNLELSPVNFALDTVLSQLRSSFDAIARQKGIEFKIEADESIPGYFYGDNLRLSQVLINLISNALRFTKSGSVTLSVKLESLAQDEARLLFKVSDTGIGMSPEVLDKIFSPFTQADSSITRRFGGTGLGLSISKNIVDQMGGSIGLESKLGQGTSFYFTVSLGLADPLAQQGEADASPSTIEKGQTILVVEDNEVNLLVIGGLLKKFEPILSFAKNGLEAVDACRNTNFDLTFMDIQMPELDGISATKIIRSNNYFGPIVALTAGVTNEDHSEIIKAGMNDFLEKPIDPTKLSTILRRWLRTH